MRSGTTMAPSTSRRLPPRQQTDRIIPVKAVTYITVATITALLYSLVLMQPALADGDVEQGAVIGYSCLGCHGIDSYRNAYPSYRVPMLGGQKRDYVEAALQAYRDGDRKHPTMQAQGGSLSSEDISNVSAWLESYGEIAEAATAESAAGVAAAAICLQCHGEGAAAVIPTPPTLSGQHMDYLIHHCYSVNMDPQQEISPR